MAYITNIILFLCFLSHQFLKADDKINCLFLDQPHQDICLQSFSSDETEGTVTSESKSVKIAPNFKPNQYTSIFVGLMQLDPLPNAYTLNLNYGFKDLPWGWWQISLGYQDGEGSHVSTREVNGGLFFEKRISHFSFLIGAEYHEQSFLFHDARLDRSIFQARIKASYSVNISRQLMIGLELGVGLPWQSILSEKHLHNRENHDEQKLLSQSVNSLDQSWPISTKLGLNYLFD